MTRTGSRQNLIEFDVCEDADDVSDDADETFTADVADDQEEVA